MKTMFAAWLVLVSLGCLFLYTSWCIETRWVSDLTVASPLAHWTLVGTTFFIGMMFILPGLALAVIGLYFLILRIFVRRTAI